MAQRSSRSKKSRSRGAHVKKPELRTGPGRAAKAERARQRDEANTTQVDRGPAVRIRPDGVGSLIVFFVCGIIGTVLVAWAAHLLHRWSVLSWRDSLWLYVTIGAAAMALPMGVLARTRRDVQTWSLSAAVVAIAMLVAEQLSAPGCPDGGQCSVIGARGSLGFVGSIVLIIVVMTAAWFAAEAMRSAAAERRPRTGRTSIGIMLLAFITPTLMFGLPVALAGTGVDVLLRRMPQTVDRAKSDVGQYCFDVDESVPALMVRPAPEGVDPGWSTFLVRRAHETRPQPGGKKLPNDWTSFSRAYPYEASISFDRDGDRTSVTCAKISPRSGNATKADLTRSRLDLKDVSITPPSAAPFKPSFLDNGPSQPQVTTPTKKPAKKPAKKQ